MDTPKDLPVTDPMDTSKQQEKRRMFTAKDLPKIAELFRNANAGSRGLDIEEFCCAMEKLHGTVNREEMTALHMKIDANCDTTVDLGELMDFLLDQNKALENMACKNHTFPKPINITAVEHCKNIIRLLFCPSVYDRQPDYNSEIYEGNMRAYQKGHYMSVSSDGIINFWTSNIDKPHTIALGKLKDRLPYSHVKKISVSDMIYIPECKELAVATSDRALLFYNCSQFPEEFKLEYALIAEDSIVTGMNYTYDGARAQFSFGDRNGFLYVFTSYKVKENGLFNKNVFEDISLNNTPTVYVSSLLKTKSEDFGCFRVLVFNDICKDIRYFQSINSFAVCGASSKTMALIILPKPGKEKLCKRVFKSSFDKEFFTCVDYAPSAERLLTGGTDGKLRVWFPYKTSSCEQELKGHVKPITHIAYNHLDKVVVSLSEDKNIRVWSEHGWVCRQSFYADGMPQAPISSMCYNIHNNELVVANSDIGKYLGKGTDVFNETLTSHNKPLCSALYHSIFKQVISVCQSGMVTVWDILSGDAVMQFKVIPDQHVGLIAMAFDGPQRRLITVYQDGKVRLWNFNNGAQFAILPVTVHKEVTCIVCVNDRVFVSGRDSNIVLDLDMNGKDNRYLEHDYLKDISSMDVHGNRLTTASSNGHIVIWDVDTAEALYLLNVKESPRAHMAGKKDQGQTGTLTEEKTKKIVKGTARFLSKKPTPLIRNETDVTISPLIVCLKTREINTNTATLLTTTDGDIYAWSVISKGGLLVKFRAVNDDGAVITTVTTDANEEVLLTGDSTGRICLWDIKKFGFKNLADKGPFEEIDRWHVSLCPPPLLGSWKSHLTGVVSVKCDPECKNIITAGWDHNVRLWTRTGCHVGLFGKHQWDATQLSLEKNAGHKQAGRSSSVEKRVNESPFIETPKQKSRRPHRKQLANEKQHEQTIEMIEEKLIEKPCTDKSADQLFAIARKVFRKCKTADMLREIDLATFPEDTDEICKSPTDGQQGLENTSEPCPPNTTPVIRNGHGLNQSSDKAPNLIKCLNEYRRERLPQRLTLNGNFLASVLPSPLHNQQGSKHTTPKREPLLPTSNRVQLRHHQNEHKPNPTQTTLTTGCTEATKSSPKIHESARRVKEGSEHRSKIEPSTSIPNKDKKSTQKSPTDGPHGSEKTEPYPPNTISVIRNGPGLKQSSDKEPRLSKFLKKHEHVRLVQQRENLKGISLESHLPSPLPVQQGSEHTTPKREYLLRIPNKLKLAHHETKVKQKPPQTTLTTGCTEARRVKEGSEHRSKHEPSTPIPNKDKKTTQTSPTDGQQGLENTSEPCPPNPTPVIRDGPGLNQSSDKAPHLTKCSNKYEHEPLLPRRQSLNGNSLKQPRIPNKVQLTHHETKLKPDPSQTTLTTGCTEATKSSPKTHESARRVKEGSEHRSKHKPSTPIPNKDKKTTQTSPTDGQQGLEKTSEPYPPNTISVIRNGPGPKQSSDKASHLSKFLKKHEHVSLLQQRRNLKGNYHSAKPSARPAGV